MKNECSSFNCTDYNSDYCKKCYHANYSGSGTDINGKIWKWDFNPQFGPLFLKKDGEPFVNQSFKENHPVWDVFNKWLKENIN